MKTFGNWSQDRSLINFTKNILACGICILALIGCSASNNVTLTANNGICSPAVSTSNTSSTSPYCMSIQILNNGGGQNWINSTNFPISGVSYSITGVSNVLNPATSASTLDPNNCAGSTISPGGSCTFYLQLNGEAFAVQSQESINVTINYTINNTLFGGSTNTASTSTTVYELTNLYTIQNSGNMTVYNNAWSNYGLIESNDVAYTMSVDNNQFGVMYIGGNLGVYIYGLSNNYITSSISPTGYSGANNFINSGNTMYAALKAGTVYNLWSLSYSTESWVGQYSSSSLTGLINNGGTVSSLPVVYLTNGSSIYSCQNSSSGSGSCPTEGTSINTGGSLSGITSLIASGFSLSNYTGLYAGTAGGIYIESGVVSPNPNATWSLVSGPTSAITVMQSGTIAGTASVFAGDDQGNIWQITSTNPESASLFANVSGTNSISAMAIGQFGSAIYVTTASGTIYQCTSGATCTSVLTIINVTSPSGGTNNVQGMAIGSILMNSLNNPYNSGGL